MGFKYKECPKITRFDILKILVPQRNRRKTKTFPSIIGIKKTFRRRALVYFLRI